jgi:hypothetical protein
LGDEIMSEREVAELMEMFQVDTVEVIHASKLHCAEDEQANAFDDALIGGF